MKLAWCVAPLASLLLSACDQTYNPRNTLGAGPARVKIESTPDPGEPGSYAILAKTGISNVTGSAITGGNLGLSPAAASYVTGFSLVADSSNTFSTSSSVIAPGRVIAADYAAPAPAGLTKAVLEMEAAYEDAASRSPPDHLNPGAGDLGGLTLAPGVYSFGTNVTIPTDLTLAGGADDVWIFQIAGNLDVSSAKRVVLSGGARARNVFWQVAGHSVIHASAHFAGILLCKTAITLQTSASMTGRAFAQTRVALDDNAITAP